MRGESGTINEKFLPKRENSIMKSFSSEFIEQSILRMQENVPRINKCFSELSEKQVWQKPNDASNSIGNLILHLCGNITQYIISSLGGNADQRERDLEFSTRDGMTKNQLIDKLTKVVDQSVFIMSEIPELELMRKRKVQAFDLSGIGIIIHVVEHFSYHTGQIAFLTKQLINKDLGFYEDIDLNSTN